MSASEFNSQLPTCTCNLLFFFALLANLAVKFFLEIHVLEKASPSHPPGPVNALKRKSPVKFETNNAFVRKPAPTQLFLFDLSLTIQMQ